jgi:hypothetical protein
MYAVSTKPVETMGSKLEMGNWKNNVGATLAVARNNVGVRLATPKTKK